jgi:hypothetical protein
MIKASLLSALVLTGSPNYDDMLRPQQHSPRPVGVLVYVATAVDVVKLIDAARPEHQLLGHYFTSLRECRAAIAAPNRKVIDAQLKARKPLEQINYLLACTPYIANDATETDI